MISAFWPNFFYKLAFFQKKFEKISNDFMNFGGKNKQRISKTKNYATSLQFTLLLMRHNA